MNKDNTFWLSIWGRLGPKTALISVYGEVACSVEAVPVILLPGGGAEQDPALVAGHCFTAGRVLAKGLRLPTISSP